MNSSKYGMNFLHELFSGYFDPMNTIVDSILNFIARCDVVSADASDRSPRE